MVNITQQQLLNAGDEVFCDQLHYGTVQEEEEEEVPLNEISLNCSSFSGQENPKNVQIALCPQDKGIIYI